MIILDISDYHSPKNNLKSIIIIEFSLYTRSGDDFPLSILGVTYLVVFLRDLTLYLDFSITFGNTIKSEFHFEPSEVELLSNPTSAFYKL